jgi:hypothetical protein
MIDLNFLLSAEDVSEQYFIVSFSEQMFASSSAM